VNTDIITLVKSKIEEIEQLQRDKAKQEGQREQMYKQLKEVSGTTSLKEAEKKLKDLCMELVDYEKLLKDLVNTLDEIILTATTKKES